jgi:cytidine deaminase
MVQQFSTDTIFTAFSSLEELPIADQELVTLARQACNSSYSPYSNFKVGAALRLVTGEFVLGSNQENAAYPSGLCAERVALFSAGATYPNVPIQAIAIAAFKPEVGVFVPVTPCGSCRQVLLEYEFKQQQSYSITIPWKNSSYLKADSVATLLPLSFNPTSL